MSNAIRKIQRQIAKNKCKESGYEPNRKYADKQGITRSGTKIFFERMYR